MNSVSKRWKQIRLAVGKFCGCYAAIKQLNQSGKTDEDRLEDAMTMFESEQRVPFDYLEAWRELRDEPKWLALPDSNSNPRARKISSVAAGGVGNDCLSHPEDVSTQKKTQRPSGIQNQKSERSLEKVISV
ncbi:unnamed protein product [Phytophthora fragariaefolia]|uniref:Unnamed protein product n=1 Tax=Phytophthora fragariaefolia TaxID=1490495 RepID=A0A9W7CU16_9STRA|nr:unnamed protein product [Phytophthora fragariaefolia]